jgi:hypothetical protein
MKMKYYAGRCVKGFFIEIAFEFDSRLARDEWINTMQKKGYFCKILESKDAKYLPKRNPEFDYI